MSNDHDYESRVESDLEEAREDTMEQGTVQYIFLFYPKYCRLIKGQQ